MSHIDILIAGTVYADLIFQGVRPPKPGTEVFAEQFTICPGGAANRAVAASRLGTQVAILTYFSSDELGKLIYKLLEKEPNLHLEYAQKSDNVTTPTTISLTDNNDRSFITFEKPQTIPPFREEITPKIVYLDASKPLPKWAYQLQQSSTLLASGVGWDSSKSWEEQTLLRFQEFDINFMNDKEALAYTHTSTIDEAIEVLQHVSKHFIITLGKKGAVAYCLQESKKPVYTPTIATTTLDTTGAGDTFAAAYMVSLIWNWDIRHRLQFANLCASLSVRSLGGSASSPTLLDIAHFLQECPQSTSQEYSFILEHLTNIYQ